jgi:V8-like Glu-specific endopeptidase
MAKFSFKVAIILAALLSPFPASPESSDEADIFDVVNNPTTVTGALEAPAGSFASVVRLIIKPYKGDNDLCTGSLIHESLVLTAAHCVLKDGYEPNWIRVTWGEIEQNTSGKIWQL